MYRALAFLALEQKIALEDTNALVEMAKTADLDLDCGPTHTRVKVNGKDVSEAIRTMAVAQATTPIARTQAIRDILVEKQRTIGHKLGAFVTEGRDQGSVVFTNAGIRFVVDASLERRAERRHQELTADGEDVDIETVKANLATRDANDAKQWAALLEPGAAIRIDTSHMTIAEVVDHLAERVREVAANQPQKKQSPRNFVSL